MFHAASCETDEDVIKINKCNPKAETECEDVEVPSQKMEFVIKCQNVTTTYCSNDLTTVHTEGGENNNIEESFAPIVPLLEHTCVETVQEYCYQEPEVTDIQTTVSRCLVSRLPSFWILIICNLYFRSRHLWNVSWWTTRYPREFVLKNQSSFQGRNIRLEIKMFCELGSTFQDKF